MNDKSREQREFTRVQVPLKGDIHFGDVAKKGLAIRNLSLKGLFLVGGPGFPKGAECDLVIRLEGASPAVEVRVRGRVARSTAAGMGIEFLRVGLDGFEHLKNLVRYNSEQVEQVEEEFDSHQGLKKKKEP